MSLNLWLPFYLGTGLLIGALLSDGEEDAELLGFQIGRKRRLYMRGHPGLSPYHLGPAQLSPSATSV